VLVCGALGAVVANREPRPTAFLAVTHLVPVGLLITASDLESVSISPTAGLDAIPLQDAGQVIGHRAIEALAPGSLLVPGDLAAEPGLPAGSALVGTSLAVNQTPSQLATGERVLVVLSGTGSGGEDSGVSSSPAGATLGGAGGVVSGAGGVVSGSDGVVSGGAAAGSSSNSGAVLSPTGSAGSVLTQATVVSVSVPAGASGTVAAASTAFVVSLEVPETAAAAVTAASAEGNIALAVLGGTDGAGASR